MSVAPGPPSEMARYARGEDDVGAQRELDLDGDGILDRRAVDGAQVVDMGAAIEAETSGGEDNNPYGAQVLMKTIGADSGFVVAPDPKDPGTFVVGRAGVKDRLHGYRKLQKDVWEKEKWNQRARGFGLLGHVVTYGILGLVASRAVEFQSRFETQGVKMCSPIPLGWLRAQAGGERDVIAFQRDYTNRHFHDGKLECDPAQTDAALPAHATEGNWTINDYLCGSERGIQHSEEYDKIYSKSIGFEKDACTGESPLPSTLLIYFAGAVFTLAKFAEAIFEFFAARDFDKYQSRTQNVYATLRALVIVMSETVRGGKLATPPHIAASSTDNARVSQILACLALCGVGNWLVSKGSVAAGLVVIVVGSSLATDGVLGLISTRKQIMAAFYTLSNKLLVESRKYMPSPDQALVYKAIKEVWIGCYDDLGKLKSFVDVQNAGFESMGAYVEELRSATKLARTKSYHADRVQGYVKQYADPARFMNQMLSGDGGDGEAASSVFYVHQTKQKEGAATFAIGKQGVRKRVQVWKEMQNDLEEREKMEKRANESRLVSQWAMLGILGYIAAATVQFQNEFEVRGTRLCDPSILGYLRYSEEREGAENAGAIPKANIGSPGAEQYSMFESTGHYTWRDECVHHHGDESPLSNFTVNQFFCAAPELDLLRDGKREPTCVSDSALPPANFIFFAGAVFTACQLAEAFCIFLTLRDHKPYFSELLRLYNEICGIIEIQTYKVVQQDVRVPRLVPESMDVPRVVQGLCFFLLIGAGNWLVSKNYIAFGLGLIVVASVAVNDSVVGFAQTERDVMSAFFKITERVSDQAADFVGARGDAHYDEQQMKRYNEARQSMSRVALFVEDPNKAMVR